MNIYDNRFFNDVGHVGAIILDSIPTTSLYPVLNEGNRYFLTNLVEVVTGNDCDGLYLVAQTLIYTGDAKYPQIDLVLELYSEKIGNFLYLTGEMAYGLNESFIKLKLIGDVVTETKALVIPRTSLDYIVVDDLVYECYRVIYKDKGVVEISTALKGSLSDFRNTTSL